MRNRSVVNGRIPFTRRFPRRPMKKKIIIILKNTININERDSESNRQKIVKLLYYYCRPEDVSAAVSTSIPSLNFSVDDTTT